MFSWGGDDLGGVGGMVDSAGGYRFRFGELKFEAEFRFVKSIIGDCPLIFSIGVSGKKVTRLE